MKPILKWIILLLPIAAVHADDPADRSKIFGAWVESGHRLAAWVIDSIDDGLHVTQIEGTTKVAEFKCKTDGHNCDVKIAGHKAEVSLYYNGNVLVELETKGDQVVKRRFSALASGNSMKLEVIPISGHVQTEQLQFEHGQVPTAK